MLAVAGGKGTRIRLASFGPQLGFECPSGLGRTF